MELYSWVGMVCTVADLPVRGKRTLWKSVNYSSTPSLMGLIALALWEASCPLCMQLEQSVFSWWDGGVSLGEAGHFREPHPTPGPGCHHTAER